MAGGSLIGTAAGLRAGIIAFVVGESTLVSGEVLGPACSIFAGVVLWVADARPTSSSRTPIFTLPFVLYTINAPLLLGTNLTRILPATYSVSRQLHLST